MSVFDYSILGCIAVRVALDFISISSIFNKLSISAFSMETRGGGASCKTLVKILSARCVWRTCSRRYNCMASPVADVDVIIALLQDQAYFCVHG